MTAKKVTVGIQELDARSIAMLVQTASAYRSRIILSDGQKKLPAKSIMSIMAMGLALGDQIEIMAEGTDEAAAAEAVAAFLEEK